MLLDQLLGRKYQTQTSVGCDPLLDGELYRYLAEYLICCRVDNKSPATLIKYETFVTYFFRFLSSSGLPEKLSAVDRNVIRLYVISLQERKLTPETVSSYFVALHTFFNWLESEHHFERNPFTGLHAPKVPKKHVKGFSEESVSRIFRVCHADTSFAGVRNLAMVCVILDTGARRAELVGMQLSDLFIEQKLVRVMGKGSKERILAMGETTMKALLKYLLRRKDKLGAVWVNEECTRPLTANGVACVIKRLAKRAGLPASAKRGAHTYRHTAATNYLKNGGNLKCLQEMLGHEKISTTEKYLDALGPEFMIADHKTASPVDKWLGKKSRS